MITIAICTFNRAESLRRTLESLVAMQVPANTKWELIVVNNNSIDHTDTVIAAFTDRLPMRREFESRSGLSIARNRAIDVARGDYIVWTDDDVIVDPGWLAAYAEAFHRWPEAAAFGGRIIPQYEPPAAGWVIENQALLGGAYALRDFGDEPLVLSIADKRIPYGANFALRTAEQRQFRYNPGLGFSPVSQRGGDEVDVVIRLLQSGAGGYWVPNAQVCHCIGHNRQTTEYLTRFFAGVGELDAVTTASPVVGHVWFGVPRWAWRQLVEEWLRYRIHRLISPPRVWLRHLRAYAYAWGAVRYYRQAAGGRAGQEGGLR